MRTPGRRGYLEYRFPHRTPKLAEQVHTCFSEVQSPSLFFLDETHVTARWTHVSDATFSPAMTEDRAFHECPLMHGKRRCVSFFFRHDVLPVLPLFRLRHFLFSNKFVWKVPPPPLDPIRAPHLFLSRPRRFSLQGELKYPSSRSFAE